MRNKLCKCLSTVINRTFVRYLSDNQIKENLEVIGEYIFCSRVLRSVFRSFDPLTIFAEKSILDI